MKKYDNKIILLGIGNSGREDDGLGWAFLDEIKDILPSNIDIDYRYQLQIEDAELISHYDTVYFIDAHKDELKNGFNLSKCHSIETHHFSSHELPPETILFLANSIYNKTPNAFILGITGISFELKIGLTVTAQLYLKNAVSYFKKHIMKSHTYQTQ